MIPLANGRIELHAGDCLDVLATLQENSIDSCVTDPPYHLTSMSKPRPDLAGKDNQFARRQAQMGFMGKQWDGGDIAFRPEVWAKVFRVLKPGAHIVAFGSTRTFHRLACAIEDAGFEIRDSIAWVYASGFPKSHDVSKGIDRANGRWRGQAGEPTRAGTSFGQEYERSDKGEPITDAARAWEGWGTAIKPSMELVCLARKPLSEGTVAANVLKHGTGALNIDACRIGTESTVRHCNGGTGDVTQYRTGVRASVNGSDAGRWPANVCHDGSEEVVAAFPESSGTANGGSSERNSHNSEEYWGEGGGGFRSGRSTVAYGDSGSAARFFYTSKADAMDRLGSAHPTIKPVDLMQWLVRLITPPNGLTLDPFAGTGTTGEAAFREGMRAVLIEREPDYQADIRRRMDLLLAGPDERNWTSLRAGGKVLGVEALPLFGAAL